MLFEKKKKTEQVGLGVLTITFFFVLFLTFVIKKFGWFLTCKHLTLVLPW